MIHVFFDDEIEEPIVDFSGDCFSSVLSVLKGYGFTYIPQRKQWTAHPKKILSTLHDLRDIEDVDVDEFTLDLLREQASKVRGIRRYRSRFDPTVMKVPPIEGKPPNEDYQLRDLKRLIQTNRKGVFWKMGLGKTWLLVNAINQYFVKGQVEKVLIVAPTEGVVNWTREIQKFSDLFPAERVTIADRDNREPFLDHHDIVVMTYRTFLMISDDYYKKSKNGKKGAKKYRKPVIPFEEWGSPSKRMIVLDEAHATRNRSARQTHVLNLHKEFFEYRYLLTGTPADKIEHYYSLMRFLDEDIIPESFTEWIQGIANVGDRFSRYSINSYYPEKVEKFIEDISPYIIRRNTEDHVDLPENYVEKIFVRLEGLQKDIYHTLITDAVVETQDRHGSLTLKHMFNQFPYLILALDNPGILLDSRAERSSDDLKRLLAKWKFEKHNKLPITESLYSKYAEEGRKVIIWSGHPQTIDELAEHFSKKNPFKIHGQMDFRGMTRDKFRDEMVEDFKRSSTRNLLIASYKVLNSAVNLTEVTRNIYFDRPYSLTEWLQSQKRTHRIGQKERVITNPLIFEQSIDLRLDHRLETKEDIDKKLLQRNQISMEEWKALFTGDVTI